MTIAINRSRSIVYNLVWDVLLLDWVEMTQPAAGAGGAGDASAANQLLGNISLASIDTKTSLQSTAAKQDALLTELQLKADLTETQPVSVASLPLPSGAATAAKQDTGNTSVASLDTKTPALGQALAAASRPVVLTAIQQAALTPPAAIVGFALETGGNLATVKTNTDKIPSQGQALAAASTPVVLTAIQVAALTPPAAITGYALEAGHLATIDTSTAKIPSQGQALAAASLPVVLTAIQQAALTPPAAIAGFNLEATQLLVKAKTDNLDVALSTRLKPADTLAGVTTVAAVTSITNAVTVTPPTLTKGVQAATGFSVQPLKDAGRNVTNYFMAAGIAGTAAEVMQSLTGYKAGAAVVATATPAVVTAAKIYRVTSITLSYQSLATAGACLFRLRANLSGVGVVTSPLVMAFTVGSLAAVAGVTNTLDIPFPDGLEFAAGTGIAVGMLGLNTLGAAAAAGFGTITIYGYEY